MEWFIEDVRRGQIALTVVAITLAITITWLGRRKRLLAVPVALVFLLFAAMVIPSAIPARPTAQRNACIYNLRMIREAKVEWAKKDNKPAGEIPTVNDLYGANGTNGIPRRGLTCPSGGTYTLGAVGQNPTCSLANKGHRLE